MKKDPHWITAFAKWHAEQLDSYGASVSINNIASDSTNEEIVKNRNTLIPIATAMRLRGESATPLAHYIELMLAIFNEEIARRDIGYMVKQTHER